MTINEATLQHKSVHKLKYDQLPGHITKLPEVKWGMQDDPDNKGRPIEWD